MEDTIKLEISKAEAESLRHQHPVVQAVLAMFPGATIIPALARAEALPTQSLAELATQPIVNDDGDVVVSENEFTEDDL